MALNFYAMMVEMLLDNAVLLYRLDKWDISCSILTTGPRMAGERDACKVNDERRHLPQIL